VLPFLFTDDVPEGAELVDCSVDAGGGWRPAHARVVPAPTLLAGRAELDKDATYVLFCRFGTQSAHAAEVLQQLGYEAYAFRGGSSALRRVLEEGRPGRVAS
jgi:thiamine biosynthesis protein ThiI